MASNSKRTLHLLSIGKEFPQFSNQELNLYVQHYQEFDLDKNDEIDRNELRNMMQKLHEKNIDDNKLDSIIQEVDKTGKGTIDFRDFLSVMDHIKKGERSQFGDLYLAAVKEKVMFFQEATTKETEKKMQNMKFIEEDKKKTKELKEKKKQENEAYEAEKERKRKEAELKKQEELRIVHEMAEKAKSGKGTVSTLPPSSNDPDEETKQKLAEKARILAQKQKEETEKEKQKKEQMSSRSKAFEQPQSTNEIQKTQIDVKGNVSSIRSKFQ